MKVDVTSDIHVDFWVDIRNPINKQNRLITDFVFKLLPESPSDVLVIAGDIGHYNWQNAILFETLRKTYKKILWVHGNHDLYMVSHKIEKKFNNNSFDRLRNMVELSNKIDGVHYLDGTIMEFGDFTIGGTGGWYDGSYGIERWGLTKEKILTLHSEVMNDYNFIRSEENTDLDMFEYSSSERRKLKDIHTKCDLIVTHIAPDSTHIPSKYAEPSSSFYTFNGRNILMDMKENAHWLFGHTHDQHYFQHTFGPTMICNPLGYPNEMSIEKRKFMTIQLGTKMPTYDDVFK